MGEVTFSPLVNIYVANMPAPECASIINDVGEVRTLKTTEVESVSTADRRISKRLAVNAGHRSWQPDCCV